MSHWLLYGITGYTGKLITREAVKRGLKPVVAGRDRAKVERIAKEFGCECRVFALDDPQHVADRLRDFRVVLNCAGPFARTAPTLMSACVKAGCSYLDITGELDVIEQASRLNALAKRAGVTILPAVGFDVVPTDCLAALLKEELPSAVHLSLAFTGAASTSPGTTKTVLASLPEGGRARIDGKIETVPVAWKKRTIPFSTGVREATTIPWGDVSSAYHTTKIPNIDVYMAIDHLGAKRMRRLRKLAPLLRYRPVLKAAEWLVDRFVAGPIDDELVAERVSLWGEVRDADGLTASATLETPNGYLLTGITAVNAVERVLAGQAAPGFQTPARAFGKEFIFGVPNVEFAWQHAATTDAGSADA